jgi:hypothetical protein
MRPLHCNTFPALLLVISLSVASCSVAAGQQELPPQPKNGAKVCVATIANASTTSVFVERLTERLTKDLQKNKTNAVMMDSATTTQGKLQPTLENGEESREKGCDYVLLGQIRDPSAHPFEPQIPTVSIGGRVPSVDASDPLGGSSGPVYRDNLQVAFALFRRGRPKPDLDTLIQERPSANVSDTFLNAMDRVANRVSHELNKK